MRSRIVTPAKVKCFTEYLRAKGYYCTNRSKTDYQFEPPVTAWDQQGNKHKDWAGREEGQPFFSVINLTVSHESQIRHNPKRHAQILKNLKPEQIHDPDNAAKTLPPYLPNTPAARKNWAWYHDNISEMDRQAGAILKRLKNDGLADNTVVIYWSDHGMGMPRGKRWLYDTGLHVPVIVRWPGKVKPGSVREDLVSLIDLTPTTLSIAGADVPDYMHGRVILGEAQQPEPKYLYFHRDRMDESLDFFRAARDHRYKYIRNFEPEKPYSQGIDYMDMMPAMKDWRRLAAEGKLKGGQKNWHAPTKPIEELYDTKNDPYELVNLADKAEHKERLAAMRKALEDWQVKIGDLGLMPEPVLMNKMRPGNKKAVTAEPTVSIQPGNATSRISISCPTPGASIAYAIMKGNGGKPQWKLYSGPFRSQQRVTLWTKACRIGYRDSKVVRKPIQ